MKYQNFKGIENISEVTYNGEEIEKYAKTLIDREINSYEEIKEEAVEFFLNEINETLSKLNLSPDIWLLAQGSYSFLCCSFAE